MSTRSRAVNHFAKQDPHGKFQLMSEAFLTCQHEEAQNCKAFVVVLFPRDGPPLMHWDTNVSPPRVVDSVGNEMPFATDIYKWRVLYEMFRTFYEQLFGNPLPRFVDAFLK